MKPVRVVLADDHEDADALRAREIDQESAEGGYLNVLEVASRFGEHLQSFFMGE